jgi:hypothetical protein
MVDACYDKLSSTRPKRPNGEDNPGDRKRDGAARLQRTHKTFKKRRAATVLRCLTAICMRDIIADPDVPSSS